MSPSRAAFDVVVIGGGFFGCATAAAFAGRGSRVVLFEQDDGLLRRASYGNQARIHNGYHYPRSILTAVRSRVNYPRFRTAFRDCVVSDFRMYYAVARDRSNVTASQFVQFCRRIEAPLTAAPPEVVRWFDPVLVEDVWTVDECAFDAARLARQMGTLLDSAGVDVRLKHRVTSIEPDAKRLRVGATRAGATRETQLSVRWVFNCTYSSLNWILARAHGQPIRLKHELAEIALVDVPHELDDVGVTVMCGPFFSLMPFPAAGSHSLSHVRYTPRFSWVEPERDLAPRSRPLKASDLACRSSFAHMIRDASRFLPLLRACRYKRSLWEIKTVLPQSESLDDRPILFARDPTHPGLVSVLGAKIDNVFDLQRELAELAATA